MADDSEVSVHKAGRVWRFDVCEPGQWGGPRHDREGGWKCRGITVNEAGEADHRNNVMAMLRLDLNTQAIQYGKAR